MTTTATTLALSQVVPDEANVRTIPASPEADRELRQSIETHGILTPLLVRANGAGHFVLVDGHRRYQAAKAAKLPSVPVRVLEVPADDGALLGAIVNLQRTDLHPMDEARLLGLLAERATTTPHRRSGDVADEVALWAGRSRSHVLRRIALLNLTDPIQKQVTKGAVPLNAAVILAGLPKDAQADALKEAARYQSVVQGLRSWIREQEHELTAVPWAVADAALVPAAGPCTTCPKRTGANPELFVELDAVRDYGMPGKTGDRCLDRACFTAKLTAHAKAQVRKARDEPAHGGDGEGVDVALVTTREYGPKPSHPDNPKAKVLGPGEWVQVPGKPCPSAHPAVDLGGEGKAYARILTICTDRKCPTHAKAAKAQAELHGTGTDRDSREAKRRAASAATARKAKLQDGQVERAICEAVVAKAPATLGAMSWPRWQAVIPAILDHVRGEQSKALLLLLGWAPPRPTPVPKAKRKSGELIRRYLDNAGELLDARIKALTPEDAARVLVGVALLGKYDGMTVSSPAGKRVLEAFGIEAAKVKQATLAALAAKGTPARTDQGTRRGPQKARKGRR